MIIFQRFANLNSLLLYLKKGGKSIGFVPTMGALHQGHLSLIGESKRVNDFTVCSIFVNPTQFNNSSDLTNYPRTLSNDICLLENSGCDFLLLPSVDEVYPPDYNSHQQFPLGPLETILEGEFRPGHFQGVCMVMNRFLKNIKADDLFMGSKDFQQCRVVQRLLETEEIPVKLHTSPTLREADGLAMSSRNLRLLPHQREKAPRIFKELSYIQRHISPTNFGELKNEAVKRLEEAGFQIDYLELARANNLELLENYLPEEKQVLLTAAHLGEIRLIDNVTIN